MNKQVLPILLLTRLTLLSFLQPPGSSGVRLIHLIREVKEAAFIKVPMEEKHGGN